MGRLTRALGLGGQREDEVVLRSRFYLPRWKRLLILAALLFVVVPIAVSMYRGRGDAGRTDPSLAPTGARALLGGDAPVATSAEAAGPWGTTAFRLGISFLAGFVVAYVMRAVLRLAISTALIALVVVVALQYLGVTLISFSNLGAYLGQVPDWLALHVDDVKQAMRTHLPSSVAALAGWLVGLTRSR